jgi:hypothetical protein
MMKTRLQEIWKWLSSPPAEPLSESAAQWGAGMLVDNQSFTTQLCQLRRSLAAHEAPAKKPVESLAIEFGNESAA